MADEHMEHRTYVGETSTMAFEGWAGLRIDTCCELHVTYLGDGTVSIMLDHHKHVMPGVALVMTVEQFNKWFVK
jgi:hypothetical protein